jgi:methylated-DNA-[protein]-cysteine S-methyltransferase
MVSFESTGNPATMQTLMRRTTFPTPLGRCALSWHEAGLTGFNLPEAAVRSDDETAPPVEIATIIARVQRHLAGEPQDFSDLHYDFAEVPAFNLEVLRATLAVKSGQTRSYGEIATAIGQPLAASRAVGAALGANRWPLLIPCHRVVAADGRMTGFSGPGGIKTKLRLLALEGSQLFAE